MATDPLMSTQGHLIKPTLEIHRIRRNLGFLGKFPASAPVALKRCKFDSPSPILSSVKLLKLRHAINHLCSQCKLALGSTEISVQSRLFLTSTL